MTVVSLALLFALGGSEPPSIAQLIDAHRLAEAEARLPSLPESVRPRFAGLIALQRNQPEDALRAFKRALEAPPDATPKATPDVLQLHLYLAHVYLLLERPGDALTHARLATPLAQRVVAQPLLEARASENSGDVDAAYRLLTAAVRTFPEESRPRLELVAFASRQGLPHTARDVAQACLAGPLARETALVLLQLLHRDRWATPLLEEVAQRFAGDADVRAALGRAYVAQQRWHAAARLFAEATAMGGDHGFAAADQFRVAGHYREALRANALVRDAARRQAQRLAILFAQQNYGRIVALEPTWDSALIAAPAMRYRLAYAHYALGNHERAADLARPLYHTSYRDAALSLLGAMGRRVEVP